MVSASNGGYVSIGPSATFTNNGTVTATSGGSAGLSGNYTNAGNIVAAQGGTIWLSGTWTSSGTIGANANGVVNLGGTLAGTGTIDNNGGTVQINGSLTMPSTGVLNVAAGPVTLSNGTIQGGTIALAPGQSMDLDGTIINLTLSGANFTAFQTSIYGNVIGTGSNTVLSVENLFFTGTTADLDNMTLNYKRIPNVGDLTAVTSSTTFGPNLVINGQLQMESSQNNDSVVNNGTINATALSFDGRIAFTNNGTLIDNGGVIQCSAYTLVPWTNIGSLIVNGNSSSTVMNNVGTITVTSGASFTVTSIDQTGKFVNFGSTEIENTSALNGITGNGSLTLGTGHINNNNIQLTQNSGVSTISALTINFGATLDITNNKVLINYGSGPDPISSVAAWIASGYNGGNWYGETGIVSSLLQGVPNPSYGIGFTDSADPGNPAGLALDTIEIMYTLLGDANLDGKVNGTDFTIMAANFNQAVTNGWDEGDFNYDGAVNGSDFVLLADNFNQFASQSAVAAADWSALEDFAAANGISLANVPEPISAGMMVMAGLGILRRRRRSSRQ